MSILEAVLLGLIQGLTEFIPVSSSGHLVLFHYWLGAENGGLAFDVALHIGTLAALVLYFGRDLVVYLKSIFVKSENTRLTWLLAAATVPAAIIGYLLEGAAESTFRSVRLVIFNMIVFGLVMLLSEKYYKKRKTHLTLDQVTPLQAMSVGFAQALAIIPGISRSGSTITAGLFTGFDRVAATRFSFLLGIPITTGAILKVLSDSTTLNELSNEKTIFIVGIITAFLSGIFAIRFMLKFLGKHGLHVFAYYRIALGIIVLIALGIG